MSLTPSYNPSQESSASPSQETSRNSSISAASGLERSKPRHNVKFVGSDNDASPAPPKRHSVPEIRTPEIDITETPRTLENDDWTRRKDEAALSAHNKANRHAHRVKKHNSAPNSRRNSFNEGSTAVPSPYSSPMQKPSTNTHLDDIPLADLNISGRVFDLPRDSTSDDDDEDEHGNNEANLKPLTRQETQHFSEARRLMRNFTSNASNFSSAPEHKPRSGSQTPLIDQRSHEYDYVPRPEAYKRSVLSQLLAAQNEAASRFPRSTRAAQQQQIDYISERLKPFTGQDDPRKKHPDFFRARKELPRSSGNPSGTQTPLEGSAGSSGTMTPRQKRPKWYKDTNGQWQHNRQSTASIGKLLESSFSTAAGLAAPESARGRQEIQRNHSSGRLSAKELIKNPISRIRNFSSASKVNLAAQDAQIVGIADRLEIQDYIIEICKALMAYGAPTHRLEEFLIMAARKLCIQASFQYLPSCMIISFDDPDTHTTELKLIKEPTAVDLGKLTEVQDIYKRTMHDLCTPLEAMDELSEIRRRPKRFSTPVLIFMYGLAAVSVGPFAFSARPIDFPIAFLLGCVLGTLQLCLATRSSQFSHIFEVFGTFVTSFAARGFGSIINHYTNQPIFCFSALAQSSIALILPGWIILSASLELQSRNIIAGSIRMVYAIIYTLFLGFGILIGTTIMGLIYPDATNDISCHMPWYWNSGVDFSLIYTKFIWVPIFTVCLAVINQAKFRQMPWMVFISFAGYQVNYWSAQRFSQNIQVANALGAFVIGVLANGYSRFRHGVAAAAMLPAIFVMVPSGLAASGSLIEGLTSANQITHNATGVSIVNNGTQGFYDAQNGTSTTGSVYGGTIFNVGYGMVQVAVGISVGLFLSALVIYPVGKKRSGIFSF